jgi:serine/threonine-protein kinase HipA
MNKCLYCYQTLNTEEYFHKSCIKKFFESNELPHIEISFNDFKQTAEHFIAEHLNVTGVQKKLSLEGKNGRLRISSSDSKGKHYILKVPSTEYPEMIELEDLTMHLAELCSVKVVSHSLIPLQDGVLAYITKRIDRSKNTKIHMEDMCQLSEKLTEDKYKGSIEGIGKIIKKHCTFTGADLINLFEIVVFSFLVGNSDMHLKNFSLIYSSSQEIRLAPAYDLLATKFLTPDDLEESALTINGKKNKLKREDFEALTNNLGLPEKTYAKTIQRFEKSMPQVLEFIDYSFVSDDLKTNFKQLFQERLRRLSC